MDELSNVDIMIVTRDQAGIRHVYEVTWDTVLYSEPFGNDFEEILLIVADIGSILYSRLSSGPITWEDVKNFFS